MRMTPAYERKIKLITELLRDFASDLNVPREEGDVIHAAAKILEGLLAAKHTGFMLTAEEAAVFQTPGLSAVTVIKSVRHRLGCGLAEAKAFVESTAEYQNRLTR
jgi:ribosomal protein L7/L12